MKNVAKCIIMALAMLLAGSVVACETDATPVSSTEPTSAPVSTATIVPAEPTIAPTPEPTVVPTTAPTKTPSPLDLVPRITNEELLALMDSGAYIAILDVRPRESYQLGHIKGAVSFPWKPELSVVDLEMLPPGDPIVTYCDCGPGEHDSASVAVQLANLGAETEILVLADPAIEGWVEAGYPTQ